MASRRGSKNRSVENNLLALGSLLVIDEGLHPRLATELRCRGRHAVSVQELKLKGELDPDLLARVYTLHPGCVLVTADDSMPATHPEAIALTMATLAIITGRRPREFEPYQDAWEREIVHRWAHRMQEQTPRSIMRYGAPGGRAWTARRS